MNTATNTTATQTPTIQEQCRTLKEKHPDALLLLRCGGFYVTYNDDAAECSKVLGIKLTRRTSDRLHMASFPYHALDTYLPKLIRTGHRVIIYDQLEDPKLTQKLTKRGITEQVEPGIGCIR